MTGGSTRIEASIEGMREYYPAFSLTVIETEAGKQARWTGRVQPIRTTDRLDNLLDDIHSERSFYILPGGEVLHHPQCEAAHSLRDWAEKLTNPHTVFELEVKYGGDRRHPRTYVRDPVLPDCNRPHTFNDGAICPYAPWQQIWLWEEHTVVDYMAHALGWLIKRMVWDRISIWLGPEMGHDPRFLLRTIGPNEQCWCGSGMKYKKCHKRADEENARRRS